MHRPHLWPYIGTLLLGILLAVLFSNTITLILSFLLSILGSFGIIYHLMVDEHSRL